MLWPGEPPFLIFWLMVAVFSTVIAVWAWQRRPAPGARTFAAIVLSLVAWSAAQVLHSASASPAAQEFWHKAEFFGMVIVPTAWLAFVLRYTQQDKPLKGHEIALLVIEPALTVLLVWTNGAHGLVWRPPSPPALVGLPGPWFWVHITYSNILLFAGMLLFLQVLMRASRLYRAQSLTLLLGVLLTWIGGHLHTVFPAIGPAPLSASLLLFNLGATWALMHYYLFDLIPVARATVIEQMGDAVFVFDAQRRLIDCNQAAQRLLRKPLAALLGQTSEQLFPDYQELIMQYRTQGELHYGLAVGAGEAQRCYDTYATPLCNTHNEVIGHLVVLHDITARKHAEEALQKAEQEKTLILDHISELLAYQDTTHRVLWANKAAAASVGLSVAELVGRSCYEIWPQRNTPCPDCPVARARDSGQAQESEITTPDGRAWLVRGYPVRDVQGQVVGIVEVTQEITAHKRAEEALRESEERYRNLFQRVPVGLYRTTPDGQILDANAALVQMFGYPDLQSLRATNAADIFVHPEDRQRELELLERDGFVHGFQMQQRRYDGSVIWIEDHAHAVRAADGRVLYHEGSLQDITARKQAEEELQQRVAELGALQATVLDIAAPHELPELLHTIVERAVGLLHAAGGGLYLCDPERQEVRCVVSYKTKRDYTGIVLKYGEGAAGMVALTGKPLIIDDYRTWAHRGAVFEQEQPFTAVCSVPLIWQGQVIGVLHALEDVKLRRFTAQDVELLTLFANHAAIAIENARLYGAMQRELQERKQAQEQLCQRNEELANLYEIALELTAQLDLQQLLPILVERANHLLQGKGTGIYLYRPQSDDLEYVAACGMAEAFLGHVLKRGEGLAGKVLECGMPMTVDDYRHWPGRAALFEEYETGAVLSMPIKWGEQTLGILDVMRERGTPFSEEEVRLFSLLANQAAIAIHNARTVATEAHEHRRAEALVQATATLISTLELEPLLENVLHAAIQAIPAAEKGSILLVDEPSGELHMRALVGYSDPSIRQTRFVREQGYSFKALRQGRPLVIADARTGDIRYDGEIEEMRAIQSAIVAPLRYRERIIGVISLDNASRKAAFSEEDLTFLEAFANQAAVAIANAQLYDAVQQELSERKHAEEALRRRSEQLATLYDLSLEIASQLDMEQLLSTITQQAMHLLHADSADLSLYRPEHDDLQAAVVCGVEQEFVGTVLQRGEGLAGKVLESGEAMAVEDYATWPGRARIYEGMPFGAMVAVPIKWGEELLGTIDVARSSGPPFTEEEIRLLSLFANNIAVALANARLYDAAQRELDERRQAEQALRESEARYRTLFESSREGIVITDAESRIVASNPAAAEILGYSSPAELVGTSGLDLYPDATQKRTWFRTLMQEGYVEATEMRLQRRDGAEVHILGGGVLRRDAEGNILGTEMMFMDITALKRAEEEHKKLEEQLRQAQKMEALGLLAGGIAHEFNNLLTIIKGNAELGLLALTPSQTNYQELLTIYKTAERAAELTRQVLAISRRQILQRQGLDLNTLITNVATMLRRLIGEHIELHTELAPHLPMVLADSGAMEQVLMNLALNARDAMPQGGVLTIQTAPVTLDEAFCRTHADAKVGEYVRLVVADTGIGMDKTVLSRLFEPFFTTKEPGKGSGLGLSVVYGIVKQHEGFIEVESSPGQGAKFSIYLPIYQAQGQAIPKEVISSKRLPRGDETILIAEDEQPVRELAQQMLETLGYTVLTASDGAEAVELFTANAERIDLVILDAVMPRLSGHKAYEAISALRPNLPVLFITGYSAEMVHMPSAMLATLPVLQKPFAMADLGRKVRKVLDEKSEK
ncbi:MAG: GAF domain-containing protein [Anaerolineae bacterium]